MVYSTSTAEDLLPIVQYAIDKNLLIYEYILISMFCSRCTGFFQAVSYIISFELLLECRIEYYAITYTTILASYIIRSNLASHHSNIATTIGSS